MQVEIQEIKPMRVAYMRALGPYAQTLPKLWPEFARNAVQRGLFKPGAMMLSVCHDDPRVTPAEQMRGDACVTVAEEFTGDGTIKVQTIAGGRYAKAVHRGPYSRLSESWDKLLSQGVASTGHTIRSGVPCFEVYINNPQDTPEADLLTELYEPVN